MYVSCDTLPAFALVGAQVMVVERSTRYTRQNVLRIWEGTKADIRSLGCLSLVSTGFSFLSGQYNVVPIKYLQLMLTKCALLCGVEILSDHKFMDVVRSYT